MFAGKLLWLWGDKGLFGGSLCLPNALASTLGGVGCVLTHGGVVGVCVFSRSLQCSREWHDAYMTYCRCGVFLADCVGCGSPLTVFLAVPLSAVYWGVLCAERPTSHTTHLEPPALLFRVLLLSSVSGH